jgi:hypothetical protein
MDQELKMSGMDAKERREQEMHEQKMRHAEEMHRMKMSQSGQPGADSVKPQGPTGSSSAEGYATGGKVEPMSRVNYQDGGGVNRPDFPGGPKADTVPAWLSNGEYVVTAEDMLALGNGDPKRGARRLRDFLADA